MGFVDRLLAHRINRMPIIDEPHLVGWVSGAAMLVRREVIDAIGLFDAAYFLYFEETDFTLRAKRAGWDCWHVPTSRIVHLVGQASGVNTRDTRPKRRPAYWFESRRRFFVKNHGLVRAAGADLCATVAVLLARLRSALTGRPTAFPPCFLRDLLRHGLRRPAP